MRYVFKKMKNLSDEIRLAKAFCHANNCYGAESYVNGFSGYSLELLVYHYRSFLKFIKAMKKQQDKIIIDIEKDYKNKQEILMNLNSSKIQSPIILIDPTYKHRNATAALSEEVFNRFTKACKDFLKNPSKKMFQAEKINLEKIKDNAKIKKYEFILLEIKTGKQEGDIAGSKLLKFYNHLACEISRFFDIKDKGFEYNEKKSARAFFAVKSKKEIIVGGPNANDKKNVDKFKKKHKKIFVKGKRVYSKKKIDFNIKKFVNNWKKNNKIKTSEMSVEGLEIIN